MKNLLTLCLILLAVDSMQAQKFGFGIKGGINYQLWDASGIEKVKSSFVPSFNFSIKSETGFELGGTAYQRLSNRFSLNEEFVYIYRTSRVPMQATNVGNFKLKNHYISIPIFISYNFYKPLSLDFGGEFGTLINSNDDKFKSIMTQLSQSSVILGIRYKVSQKLNIHSRFGQGWTNIIPYTDLKDSFGDDLIIRKRISQTFSLALGYNF